MLIYYTHLVHNLLPLKVLLFKLAEAPLFVKDTSTDVCSGRQRLCSPDDRHLTPSRVQYCVLALLPILLSVVYSVRFRAYIHLSAWQV